LDDAPGDCVRLVGSSALHCQMQRHSKTTGFISTLYFRWPSALLLSMLLWLNIFL